jgi:hypothetical protein
MMYGERAPRGLDRVRRARCYCRAEDGLWCRLVVDSAAIYGTIEQKVGYATSVAI